jgi:hypothetical protein
MDDVVFLMLCPPAVPNGVKKTAKNRQYITGLRSVQAPRNEGSKEVMEGNLMETQTSAGRIFGRTHLSSGHVASKGQISTPLALEQLCHVLESGSDQAPTRHESASVTSTHFSSLLQPAGSTQIIPRICYHGD